MSLHDPLEPRSTPPSPIKDFGEFTYEIEKPATNIPLDVTEILKGFGLSVSEERITEGRNWVLIGKTSEGQNTYLQVDQFVRALLSLEDRENKNPSEDVLKLFENKAVEPLTILKEGALFLSSKGDDKGAHFLTSVANTYQGLLEFREQLDANPSMLAFDPEESQGSKLHSRLDPLQMLLVSLLGQSILTEKKDEGALYVKKGERSSELSSPLQILQSQLQVSFIVDPKSEELTLLSKSGNDQASVVYGGAKKVTAAVTFNNYSSDFKINVQAVNKPLKMIEKEEISLMQVFGGVRGLLGLRSFTTYQKNGEFRQSLVMDRLQSTEGVDFSENIQARLEIALDVAYGLEYLHEKGYKHGDIKPDNILFKTEVDGSVKSFLSDYGNTKKSVPGSDTIGTLQYAPPEEGQNGQKADMYALGVTLYEQYLGFDETTYLFEYNEEKKSFDLNPKHEEFMVWAKGQRDQYAKNPPDPSDKELRLHVAICKLLDPNPDTRPTAKEFRLEVESIANS